MARAAAWNRASSAASRSSNCASPASKRSWNEVRPWTAFEHAGSAGRAAQRRNLLHAERGPHHHRVVARALQQGPPAQRAWLPATGARRNHPKLAVRLRSATPAAQLGLSGRFGLTLLLDHQVHAVQLKLLVGVAGFEPATPRPPVWCANQAALHSDRRGLYSGGPATRHTLAGTFCTAVTSAWVAKSSQVPGAANRGLRRVRAAPRRGARAGARTAKTQVRCPRG